MKILIFIHDPSINRLLSTGPAKTTLPSAGETTAPESFGITRSGSLKKQQMQKVTASPINAGMLICKRAKTAVVNTEANIKGYPARATAKALGLGGSDQEKLLITLPHIWAPVK
jgi:hypothetical protein